MTPHETGSTSTPGARVTAPPARTFGGWVDQGRC